MGSAVRVRVLGGLTVEGLGERELGSRKGRTVLKALALARGRPVSTDRLADVVWGDDQPARPADQLGVLVSRLRGVLGQERLPRTDAGYALVADWLDVDELAARVDEAAGALREGRVAAARAAAEAAGALARGDLLPEEEGEWLEAERAAAGALVAAARRIAAEAAACGGDVNAAGALAELALAHDPCDEACLRILMRAHIAGGRPASALAAYARLRARLAEDLGVSPSPETEELHDAIVLGGADAGAPAGPATARPAIAGREAELAALDRALRRVTTTRASATVLVEGEAGIGKTVLVETWSASVDALVLSGRCDQLGCDLPLQPVADALAERLAGLGPEERTLLAGPDLAVVGPLLGLDAREADREATVVVDPDTGRAALFVALAAVTARLAAGRPVILVVDDVHLAAASTLAWLSFAVRRVPALLVVATARGDRPPLPADAVIPLGPLDVAAVATLVGAERAPELHARTGGQPLLVAALAGSGGESLPATLAEAVERRVSDLGPAAATLRTAAVLGSQVDLDLLAAVTQAPAVELLGHLEAAAGGGLLGEENGFRFRHELERTALDASIGSTRRALVHREAARALAGRSAPDPLAVAVHARLGGETALASDWYVTAARTSAARFDLASAESHLAAALALGESVDPLVARARVRMGALRLDEAADDAARAVALGGDARALEVAGWVAYYQRRYDDAMACADAALARAGEPALRVSCLSLAGRVLHGSGDLPGAVARLEEAVALDAPPEVAGIAAVWLAHARGHEGRPAEALPVVTRALVDADRLAHPFAPLHGRFARVLALGQLGRVGAALAGCDDLDAAIVRSGATGQRLLGPAANCRAWILRWTGQGDRADELNRRALEVTDADGPRAEAHYAGLLDLVDGHLLAGDLDGAGAALEGLAPIERWQGTMAWHQRHRWALARARLALATGDADGAADLAGGVAADATARGARRYELLAAAVGALARPAGADVSVLDTVVHGLGGCAALDGWATVAALAEAFGVDAWRVEARRAAAAVVADAPDADAARALARRLLD